MGNILLTLQCNKEKISGRPVEPGDVLVVELYNIAITIYDTTQHHREVNCYVYSLYSDVAFRNRYNKSIIVCHKNGFATILCNNQSLFFLLFNGFFARTGLMLFSNYVHVCLVGFYTLLLFMVTNFFQ